MNRDVTMLQTFLKDSIIRTGGSQIRGDESEKSQYGLQICCYLVGFSTHRYREGNVRISPRIR